MSGTRANLKMQLQRDKVGSCDLYFCLRFVQKEEKIMLMLHIAWVESLSSGVDERKLWP